MNRIIIRELPTNDVSRFYFLHRSHVSRRRDLIFAADDYTVVFMGTFDPSATINS